MKNPQSSISPIPEPRVVEGYYLDNFLKLINFVDDRYQDLLTEDEKKFHQDFTALNSDAQRLFVRLIMRKGPYFLIAKLNYDEINLTTAVEHLSKNAFVVINPQQEVQLALMQFTKPELVDLFHEFVDFKKSNPKEYILLDVIESLDEAIIWQTIESLTDLLVPLHQETVRLYKLLFFGNLRQGMEEFIFEDLGIMKFEKYLIRDEDRFFDNREVVDSYFTFSDIQYALWEMKGAGNVEEILSLGVAVSNYSFPDKFRRKKEKIFLNIGTYLEKNKYYEEALAFFAQSSLNPSKERMVRILAKQEQLEDAYELCSFLLDSENYYERDFALFFIEKIKKMQGVEYLKNSRKKYQEQSLTLPNVSNERVEDAVLKHYHRQGWLGYYSESKIWSAIAGIMLWDVIFKARPNVFFNPFQRGPVDLFSSEFYRENHEEIEAIFESLFYDPHWQSRLIEVYNQKHLVANHLVDWKRVTPDIFTDVITHLPVEHLILIARKLIINLAEFKSGLPDLLLIDPASNNYWLVEVKGPGDQLQPNQRRWLNYFEKNKLPYYVQKVTWLD